MSSINQYIDALDKDIADANLYYRDFDKSFQQCRPNMTMRGYSANYSKYAEKPEIYRDLNFGDVIKKTHKGKGTCGICLDNAKTLTNMYFCRVCDIKLCGECYGMMSKTGRLWRPNHYLGHYTTSLVETQPDCPQCKTKSPFSHRGVCATKIKSLDDRQICPDDIYDDIVLQKLIKEFIVMNNDIVGEYRLFLQCKHNLAMEVAIKIAEDGIIAGFDKEEQRLTNLIRQLEQDREMVRIDKYNKNEEYVAMFEDQQGDRPYHLDNGKVMKSENLPYIVRNGVSRNNPKCDMWYAGFDCDNLDDVSMNAVYMRFMRPSPCDREDDKEGGIDAKVRELNDRHEQLAMGVVAIERPTNMDKLIETMTEEEKAELIAKLMGGSK